METYFADYLNLLDATHQAVIDALADLTVEALDWSPGEGVNSIAVLVAHLSGAGRFWIGDMAMGEPKPRIRADEFKVRGLTAAELKAKVEEVSAYAHAALERLTLADLEQLRSGRNSQGDPVESTVGHALLHALEHTATHAGHIQLMRDWWKAHAAA